MIIITTMIIIATIHMMHQRIMIIMIMIMIMPTKMIVPMIIKKITFYLRTEQK